MTATAGYSGTPLWKKIGIREGHRVLLHGPPKQLRSLLAGAPQHQQVHDDADVVWAFTTTTAGLEDGLRLGGRMRADGMLWISWPKKTSGMETEVDENMVRRAGLAAGLVDVKVCAVDTTWSGLKFVVRLRDRP